MDDDEDGRYETLKVRMYDLDLPRRYATWERLRKILAADQRYYIL
jgi:hypothetical protein